MGKWREVNVPEHPALPRGGGKSEDRKKGEHTRPKPEKRG